MGHTQPNNVNEVTRPPQFTLRQALLSIAGLCAFLAFFRLVGLGPGIGLLFVGVMIGFSIISLLRREWWLAAVPLFILAVCVCLLLPSVGSGPPSKRMMCGNNLKQFAIALLSYHDRYGTLPPAYVADQNGRPMHSWRVLILPFMEQQALYNLYRFDEPWDGPNNSKLLKYGLPYNKCPSVDANGPAKKDTETNYLVVVGPKTAFPGDKCVALSDITDDKGNTILVVEVHNSGIHWMEPRDLHVTQMARTINAAKGQGISSQHTGGANVAMSDGSVRFLSAEELTAADVESLLTIAGNETSPQGPSK
ncbi:MAG TPA: DUF1559 domain-containing protein [Pirellulaceae bacterium]|nr:DUF1559 domain-containing protein [Pirellulaceae bacterium]